MFIGMSTTFAEGDGVLFTALALTFTFVFDL